MYLLQPPIHRDEQEPLPSCIDVQTDLGLCWAHRSYFRFCHVLAQIVQVFMAYACLSLCTFSLGQDAGVIFYSAASGFAYEYH